MILRQFLHTDPVAISYLFGCGGKAAAAVVDPIGEITPYLKTAQETGMRILYVIDTHLHADHVSAGRQLAEAAGAELAATAEEGARILFRSLERLKTLPDHIEVFPGAFSGSVCGRRLSGKPASTIGFERRYNEAFRIEDESTFVRFMQSDIPPPPPRAAELRALNAGLAVA